MGGVHYGQLKYAELIVNLLDDTDIIDRFNKDEWGLDFGVQADFYLNTAVYVHLGLRGSVSNDINSPDWQVDGKTQNLLIGANFGINFFLSKQE